MGSIAGMYDLIIYSIFFIFGSYIDFVSRVKWIKKFYRFTDCNNLKSEPNTPTKDSDNKKKKDKQLASNDGILNLSQINHPWFYLKYESCLSLLIHLCSKETESEWI